MLPRITSPHIVSKILPLSRNTIRRWRDDNWDKVKLEDQRELAPPLLLPPSTGAPAPSAPASIDPKVTEMIVTLEARELENLVQRHEGKIRRKYSLTERKLILALVDRFGSKAVHEYFHVSYDTIARLRQRAEQEIDRKPRTPLRYAV